MRPAPLLCAVALILGPAPAAIADDASVWLLQVSEAARTANYQGVVVYRDGQHMEVMRLVHRQRGGQVQERVTSLTGRPRDVLREGDQVVYLAGDGPVQSSDAQSLFPVLTRELLAEASAHYEYRDLGQARVAGRPCRGVMMAPRDEYRYGYEICGDQVSAVPLRVTLLDHAGHTVEQLMFTEVAFPTNLPDAAFTPPPGAVMSSTAAAAPATPAAAQGSSVTAWSVAHLPPGFRIVLRKRTPSPDGHGYVEHVLLSDGLSAVSVFGAQGMLPEKSFRGMSQVGAVSAYGRRIGEFQVTVVGEVPASTVRMIGDGLEAPAAESADAKPILSQ